MSHDICWWGGGMMWFIWIPILVVLGVVIYRMMGNGKTNSESETAMEILKKRYAKGEITKEEFEERKKTLQS